MMIDAKSLPPSYADAVEDTRAHDLRTKEPLNEKDVDEMMLGQPTGSSAAAAAPAPAAGPSSPLASRVDTSYIHPPYDEDYYHAAPSPSYTAPSYPVPGQPQQPQQPQQQQQAVEGETYIWTHPLTHETYDTGLPFDHPDVQCLQSGHLPRTRYGLVGILSTIFWFPFGLLVMMHDKSVECKRCSRVLAKPERNHYACKGRKQLVEGGKKVIGEWKKEGEKAVKELEREGSKMVRDLERGTTKCMRDIGSRREKWAERSQRRQEKWARKIERKEERWARKTERREAKYAEWVERKHQKTYGKVFKACGH